MPSCIHWSSSLIGTPVISLFGNDNRSIRRYTVGSKKFVTCLYLCGCSYWASATRLPTATSSFISIPRCDEDIHGILKL